MKMRLFNNLCLSLVLLLPTMTMAQEKRPADPKATKEAVALFDRLMKLQDKGVMYGHQDDLMYGYEWWYEEGRSDIKDMVGDYPAVAGFELGHIELGHERSLDFVSFQEIRDRAVWFHSIGGVVTISWHLDNPMTGGTSWDVSNPGVIKSVLKGGENHKLYMQWLKRLADYILTFRDEDGRLIPFIFRPYHEHSGAFFWWGKGNLNTNEEYAELWRMTVKYLRSRGLHNILYAYNTDRVTSWEEYMEGYPGDEYIDMLSLDMYDRGSTYFKELDYALSFVTFTAQTKGKLAALSECGEGASNTWYSVELINTLKKYKVSYVLTWRNTYRYLDELLPKLGVDAPKQGRGAYVRDRSKDFKAFYDHPHTLFYKDIQ